MEESPSFKQLPKGLHNQYKTLQAYSFLWWGIYSVYVIFRPIYLVFDASLPLWMVLLSGALESIFALFIQNQWNHIAEKKGNMLFYLAFGNGVLAIVLFLTIFINSIYSLILFSLLVRVCPNPDVLATSYIYKLSEYSLDELENPPSIKERKYFSINNFSRYRRFGSIGWAICAPLWGWFLIKTDFISLFLWGGISMIVLTIFFILIFKFISDPTHNLMETHEPINNEKVNSPDTDPSFFQSLKIVSTNKSFKIILIGTFIYSIAGTLIYKTSQFYFGLFSNNNYVLIALAFSIAAFAEWPIMTHVSKKILSTSWRKMIFFSFIGNTFRIILALAIIIFGGNLFWVYTLQILTGVFFAIRLPFSTFGVHDSLKKEQRTLGQGLFATSVALASFFGAIIGSIISWIEPDLTLSFRYIFGVSFILMGIAAGIMKEKK